MGVSMFGAVSWRRANRHGALASLVVSTGVFFWLTWQDFHQLLQWEAMNFGIAILAGFVALAVVSWMTPPESNERLDPFYHRLRTPMYFDEREHLEKPVTEPGHELLFVELFHLRLSEGLGPFYRRFRSDINGLLACFGVVVALIALAKGILYLP
jgi:Na+/proline symporter